MRLLSILRALSVFALLSWMLTSTFFASHTDLERQSEGNRWTVCAEGCDFTQIQAAIDAAQPGDTVKVREGLYKENLRISKKITLQGEGADRVRIEPSDPESPTLSIESLATKQGKFEVLVQGVVIRGFTIQPGKVAVLIGNAGATLEDNRIVGEGDGIWAFVFLSDLPITILENEIEGAPSGLLSHAGIRVGGGAIPVLISNNRIVRKAVGISVGGFVGMKAELRQNTIHLSGTGISISGLGGHVLIEENRLLSNRGTGLLLMQGPQVEIKRNFVSGSLLWGLALWQRPCFDTQPQFQFEGTVHGSENQFQQNHQDLCPADYPWPAGFLQQEP